MHQLLVHDAELQKADAKLARQNLRLLAALREIQPAIAPGILDTAKLALNRWRTQRKDECRLLGAATGAGGMWPAAHASTCELRLTATRLADLKLAVQCASDQAVPDRGPAALSCLRRRLPATANVKDGDLID